MSTIRATFDGEVFRPAAPVDLPPGTEVGVHVPEAAPSAGAGRDWIRIAMEANLPGPRDASGNLSDYPYHGRHWDVDARRNYGSAPLHEAVLNGQGGTARQRRQHGGRE